MKYQRISEEMETVIAAKAYVGSRKIPILLQKCENFCSDMRWLEGKPKRFVYLHLYQQLTQGRVKKAGPKW